MVLAVVVEVSVPDFVAVLLIDPDLVFDGVPSGDLVVDDELETTAVTVGLELEDSEVVTEYVELLVAVGVSTSLVTEEVTDAVELAVSLTVGVFETLELRVGLAVLVVVSVIVLVSLPVLVTDLLSEVVEVGVGLLV